MIKYGGKKVKIILSIFIILIIGYFIFQQGHIRINNERIGFFLLRGGYRAWWIRYSKGMTWNNEGKQINLWCKPKFEHCDIRLIKTQ